MSSVLQEPLPEEALLRTYRGGARPDRWGQHGDCFAVAIDRKVNIAEFVTAFYTSPVFRVERVILGLAAKAPSTDAQVHALADGSSNEFAIWRVAERTETQLLMCDRYEKTRSWFRVVPIGEGATILQFGSAVAADRDRETGAITMGRGFRWLMGLHVLYSKTLLNAARNQLTKGMAHPPGRTGRLS